MNGISIMIQANPDISSLVVGGFRLILDVGDTNFPLPLFSGNKISRMLLSSKISSETGWLTEDLVNQDGDQICDLL